MEGMQLSEPLNLILEYNADDSDDGYGGKAKKIKIFQKNNEN